MYKDTWGAVKCVLNKYTLLGKCSIFIGMLCVCTLFSSIYNGHEESLILCITSIVLSIIVNESGWINTEYWIYKVQYRFIIGVIEHLVTIGIIFTLFMLSLAVSLLLSINIGETL